jgi:hypothetical protein
LGYHFAESKVGELTKSGVPGRCVVFPKVGAKILLSAELLCELPDTPLVPAELGWLPAGGVPLRHVFPLAFGALQSEPDPLVMVWPEWVEEAGRERCCASAIEAVKTIAPMSIVILVIA